MKRVVGVDGCKDGWVAIWLSEAGFEQATVHSKLRDLVNEAKGVDAIAVDMPIGLADHGARQADLEARKFLSGATSSVFLMPPWEAMREPNFEKAQVISRKIAGFGFSKQAHALRDKIIELEALRCDTRVFEVHPEVSFREMATVVGSGVAVGRKKTWAGMQTRTALLAAAGITIPVELGAAGLVGADDVLDAAVGAWSALRKARGTAVSLPGEPETIRGYASAIWY